MRPAPPGSKTGRSGLAGVIVGLLIVGYLGMAVLLAPAGGACLLIPVGLAVYLIFGTAVAMAAATIQSLFEHVVVAAILGQLSRRLFFAWCEGILITYAVCAVTFVVYGEVATGGAGGIWARDASARSWMLLAVMVLESTLIQYLVVWRRARRWHERTGGIHLLLACVLAKGFIAVPWVLFARYMWMQ